MRQIRIDAIRERTYKLTAERAMGTLTAREVQMCEDLITCLAAYSECERCRDVMAERVVSFNAALLRVRDIVSGNQNSEVRYVRSIAVIDETLKIESVDE